VKGKTVEEALSIKNTDIVRELSLPPVKIHCSVLAEDAIKAAIGDWKKKNGIEVLVTEKVRTELRLWSLGVSFAQPTKVVRRMSVSRVVDSRWFDGELYGN